ncbi:MAG: 3-methyl-2-oxobutanoate hydroxymethyltransferase [Candidatus Sabulitectum sp.]|nr:3-methyl-2-oxobutanoate hydroxymethyltransferase [Candidatus Sabulitectum sp.]
MAGKRITVKTIAAMKKRGDKVVALTAYDCHTARMEEMAGVHIILVGDSFQMAVLGEETTLGADMDVLVALCRAVRKGAPDTLVVGDMPFGSYQPSDEIAVKNAVRFIAEAGADAVKLEGGNDAAISRVKAIVDAGIPVMGHIGLLPQSIRLEGSYRVVRSNSEEMLLKQIGDLEKAGAFSAVLEMIEEDVAARITEATGISTIGIGAGRYTNGQILVVNDMLGMNGDFNPKFLKKYADLHSIMKEALSNYVSDVAGGTFPGEENVFKGRGKNR